MRAWRSISLGGFVAVKDAETVPLTTAAQRLGMSWERVWRRVLSGALEGEKVGRSWRVSRESLDRAIAQQDSASGHSRGGTNGGT
jgi:excisionase family DNA binding protein